MGHGSVSQYAVAAHTKSEPAPLHTLPDFLGIRLVFLSCKGFRSEGIAKVFGCKLQARDAFSHKLLDRTQLATAILRCHRLPVKSSQMMSDWAYL